MMELAVAVISCTALGILAAACVVIAVAIIRDGDGELE